MINKYFLMHKDRKVALFALNGSDILRLDINESSKSLLPFSVRSTIDLSFWLKERDVPVSRLGLKKDLGGYSPFNLMVDNLGLSLTDCYWLKPLNKPDLAWKTVNLFSNGFKEDGCLDLKVNKGNLVPSATLQGDLKKKWVLRTDGIRCLVKGNKRESCIQSISEIFASKLHSMQGNVPFVNYDFVTIPSDGKIITGCICNAFTSEDNEFIPAIDVINHFGKKSNNISYYEYYISICNQLGVSVRPFLEYQILTDFLLSNNDRHFSNFGLIRDSNSLSFKRAAPIFDSGNSLFYNSAYVPTTRKDLLNIGVFSFYTNEVKLLERVIVRDRVRLNRLPSSNCLYIMLSKDTFTTEERRYSIVNAYEKKIMYLGDFMNGANIWDYNYQFKRGY